MATRMKPVNVVLVGVGWTAGILAKGLVEAGYSVVGLERGRFQQTVPDFQSPAMHDELQIRGALWPMQNTGKADPHVSQQARPGGAADAAARLVPPRHRISAARACTGTARPGAFCRPTSAPAATTIERYGKGFMPADLTVQDWPVTYEELEPYYDRFEYLCGIGGKAGNLQGGIPPGGNPHEGLRRASIPIRR